MKDQKLSNQFTIYSVVGPTASGKTDRALRLVDQLIIKNEKLKIKNATSSEPDARMRSTNEGGRLQFFKPDRKFAKQRSSRLTVEGVNLISVDSRQVYKGLEITTGADIPSDFELSTHAKFPYSFFKHQTQPLNLHGISIVDVVDPWSVNHFIQLASQIIDWSIKHRWAVILVGGTGLYHRQLRWFLEGKEIVDVPPSKKVRQKAAKLSVKELQAWLKEVDTQRFLWMNQSDRNNPRRLVRAIEIGTYKLKIKNSRLKIENGVCNSKRKTQNAKLKAQNSKLKIQNEISSFKLEWQTIKVLPDNLETLAEKIRRRVVKRLNQGALDEVKRLLKLNLNPDSPVMTTLGVPEMRQFLTGKITQDELIDLWSLHELQYAKRQMTWWKKH